MPLCPVGNGDTRQTTNYAVLKTKKGSSRYNKKPRQPFPLLESLLDGLGNVIREW